MKHRMYFSNKLLTFLSSLLALLAVSLSTASAVSPTAASALLASNGSVELRGPAGSGQFGSEVFVLSNGNIVITDPSYSNSGLTNRGAVYLYNGGTLSQISMLIGAHANDAVGSGGVTLLKLSSQYLVKSPDWANGTASKAGAVTLCNNTTGCSGQVSTANSLVGSQANDRVGVRFTPVHNSIYWTATELKGGGFVIDSPYWSNGSASEAGAVTLCSAAGSCTGKAVSTANSLVGTHTGDQVGFSYVFPQSSGAYVVASPNWANGTATLAGAVTFCSAAGSCAGQAVSAANSLVGSHANDQVGIEVDPAGVGFKEQVVELAGGEYVVDSPYWANGSVTFAGAVTLCSAAGGCKGTVSTANSLVGSHTGDVVGFSFVFALSSGAYVVNSPNWANGTALKAGAATFCSAAGSCTAKVVSASNSLVGSQANDQIGATFQYNFFSEIEELSGGKYVVNSANWANGSASQAGAVTLCSATTGCAGPVSAANSLVGSHTGDQVGIYGETRLSNGGYVVHNNYWTNGSASQAGAATLCSPPTGCVGPVSTANSLVGTHPNDWTGLVVFVLQNGDYVVSSPYWSNGTLTNVGSATLCSAAGSCTGQAVSTANSLTGSHTGDQLGSSNWIPLSNGGYVISSNTWNNYLGAVTLCSAAGSCTGQVVSAANSLTGSHGSFSGDQVGYGGIMELSSGNYIVASPNWINGSAIGAGAVTLCTSAGSCTGQVVSTANSLTGSTSFDHVGDSIYDVTEVSGGGYVVASLGWTNGGLANAGAVTLCTGSISSANSVLGKAASPAAINYTYDTFHKQIVVGQPFENLVSFFPHYNMFLPVLK